MRLVIVAALTLVLSGCGGARMAGIRDNYDQSLAAYKACVGARGPEGCGREKAILDADAQRYQNAWAAVNGGSDGSSRPVVYQPVGGGTYVRY